MPKVSFNPDQIKPKPEIAPRKPRREILGLHERLATLIRTITKKPKLTVESVYNLQDIVGILKGGDPAKIWYNEKRYHPVTKKLLSERVFIPPAIYESSQEIAFGSAAHEAGHVAITRDYAVVPDDAGKILGLPGLLVAIEERATDQVIRDRFEGGGKWIDEMRLDYHKEAIEVLEKFKDKVGYRPLFSQLNGLIVFEPMQRIVEMPLDDKVKKVYEEIREYVDEVEATIPKESDNEHKIEVAAFKRYKVTREKILPLVKDLLAEDIAQEELRQMVNEKMKPQETQEDGAQQPGLLDGLNEELAKELIKNILDSLKKDDDTENTESTETNKQANKEAQSAESNEHSEDRINEESNKPEESSKPSSEGQLEEPSFDDLKKQLSEKLKDNTKGGGIPIPMDKLSPQLKDQLLEQFKKQTEEAQKRQMEAAKKTLEQLEDLMNKLMQSKLSDDHIPTHEEIADAQKNEEERKKQELADMEAQKKLREEIKKESEGSKKVAEEVERKLAAMHNSMSSYDRAYEEVRGIDEELYRDLERVFHPNVKTGNVLRSSGARINLPAVFRWESAKKGGASEIDSKIFEATIHPEKKDYVFTLLVDLSSSMADGGKIIETFKAVVLMAEVLNRLGIRVEILGFQDTLITFKSFDKPMNDDVRSRMSGMIAEVSNSNLGGLNHSSWNDDGPCLLEASNKLANESGNEKFLLVFSDGIPMGRRSGSKDLMEAVSKILTMTNQKLVGLGLGKGTEHVKSFYPTALPNINVKQLSATLAGVLEDMILFPNKYRTGN